MSDLRATAIGAIAWTDLTVPDAPEVRDFYAAVVGWNPSPVDMGGYSDYAMHDTQGASVAGVCHARGVNADLPPVWLVYVRVANLTKSLGECERRGGSVIGPPQAFGKSARYAVIQDPAGAIVALFEQTTH